MKEQLFTFIQEKIGPIVGIKHYDWWNNQPDQENEEDSFDCPAVFIEISPFKIQALGRRRVSAQIDFLLHLVHQPIKRTRRGHRQQSDALNRIKTDDVINAIKGKNNASTIGSISFVMEYPSSQYDQYLDTRILFKVRMIGDGSVLPSVPASGNGEVTTVTNTP